MLICTIILNKDDKKNKKDNKNGTDILCQENNSNDKLNKSLIRLETKKPLDMW